MSEPVPPVLQEITALAQQVNAATDVGQLRPIFYRLDELGKAVPDDLDVQVAIGDIKQLLAQKANDLNGPAAAPRTGPVESTPTPVHPQPPSQQPAGDGATRVIKTNWSSPPSTPVSASPAPQMPPMQSIPAAEPARPQPPSFIQQQMQPPPTPAPAPAGSNLVLWVIAFLLFLILAAAAYWFFVISPNRPISVNIRTTPPGAAVMVGEHVHCNSDCDLALPPGSHQVMAKLAGYATASANVTLLRNQPAPPVTIALVPAAQILRIVSNFTPATIALDRAPPVPAGNGSFTQDPISPGHHTVRIAAPDREVQFSLDVNPPELPLPSGAITTKNAVVAVVASMGAHARLFTSAGPWKLRVNGQDEHEAGAAGVELKNFRPGENELVIGEGPDQRIIKHTFAESPAFTAFLHPAQDAGTLTVSTSEDGAKVIINGQEQPAVTANGQYRMRLLGAAKVQVSKDGFVSPEAKMASVAKDQDVRVTFTLTPKVASAAAPLPRVPAPSAAESPRLPEPPATAAAAAAVAIPTHEPQLASAPPPIAPASPPAPPKIGTIADFDIPDSWHQENGLWRHRGHAFHSYKLGPAGLFTFDVTALKGGRVRWSVDYADARNFTLFELDEEALTVQPVVDGKRMPVSKLRHGVVSPGKRWSMQVEVAPASVTHRIQRDRQWIQLDTRSLGAARKAGGKFGFLVLGSDEIALASFRFEPR